MVKVSIIIPLYRVEKYVERAINSVIQQTYRGEIECIIIDDCSPAPDSGWEIANTICEKYDGTIKFKLIKFNKNMGVSVARNFGIDIAAGDYIFFIDGDDYITADCIEKLVAYIDKYPNVDLVQSNFTRVFEDGSTQSNTTYLLSDNIKEVSFDRKWVMYNFISRSITVGTPWNMLIRRALIIDNKIYFKEGLAKGEDNLWVYMIGKYISSICISLDVTYMYLKERKNSAMYQSLNDISFANAAHITILNNYIANIDSYCKEPQIELIYRYILNLNAFGEGKKFRADINIWLDDYTKHLNLLGHFLVWMIKILPSYILKRKIIYNGLFLKLQTRI